MPETKAEAVDIKEYVAILLKRKWLILVCFLLSMAGTTAFLFTRQPVYRANSKLLVQTTGSSVPSNEVTREDDARFYSTQLDILMSQTMLHRVQVRMKKTADEIREYLIDLKVAPVRNSAIIMITVDSPSTDFAREFANALADEYFRYRDELRAANAESALLMLTREITRLGQELKASQEKLLVYAREHNMPDIGSQNYLWYKRYALNAGVFVKAMQSLSDAKARKTLLDTRADLPAVMALLSAERSAVASAGSAPSGQEDRPASVDSRPVKPGMFLVISVDEDASLTQMVEVSAAGTIEFPKAGTIVVNGMTIDEVARKIKEGLEARGFAAAKSSGYAYADQWGRFDAGQVDPAGSKATVRVAIEDSPAGGTDVARAGQSAAQAVDAELAKTDANRSGAPSRLSHAALGALTEVEAQRLFEWEAKRRDIEARVVEMRQVFKQKHPALVQAEGELQGITSQLERAIDFLRQKADADLMIAQKKYDEVNAASAELEKTAIYDQGRTLEVKNMTDEIERIRTLYNTMVSQLMKLDMTQNINSRTISVLEPAIVEPDPVYPKKVKGLLLAAFFGLGLGLALAFFIEYIDDSIKLAEEVERDLQLPFLGMIPAAQWNPDDVSAHRLDRLKQQGGVAEAYRVVRSAIIFSIPREKLRSILLTSAVPREGKTTTCVNLSIGFAQTEERILLIDADLRRGEIHKYFGVEKDKGLADVLLGEATPEEVVKHTDVPRLDVITVGSYPANPAELLLGWRLKELLEWGYQHYDRIIIDCTPVMGIADSAILGAAVDGVLFIIWAGRTSRRYVRVAKMTAVSRGAKVFGFVLNNLEPGRVGYYHYYPYYYSYYSRGYYYAHREEDEGKGGDIKGVEVSSPDDKKDQMDDVY